MGADGPVAAGQEAQRLRSSIRGEGTEPPALPCRALSVPPLLEAAPEKLLEKGRRARNLPEPASACAAASPLSQALQ